MQTFVALQESLAEESKRTSLRYQVKKLQEQKSLLEKFMETHLNNRNGHRCILKAFPSTQPNESKGTDTSTIDREIKIFQSPKQESSLPAKPLQGKLRTQSLSIDISNLTSGGEVTPSFSQIGIGPVSHQSSNGSAINSTPSPNPVQIPFISYNTTDKCANTTTGDHNLFHRANSSPAAPVLSFSSSNGGSTDKLFSEVTYPKPNHSFIPLDQYKAMAVKIAEEKQKTANSADSATLTNSSEQLVDDLPIKKTKLDSNMNVTTPAPVSSSDTLTFANTVTNSLLLSNTNANGLEASENPSQHSFNEQTYTYIACEVDPNTLKEQGIDIEQGVGIVVMEEVPDTSTTSTDVIANGTLLKVTETAQSGTNLPVFESNGTFATETGNTQIGISLPSADANATFVQVTGTPQVGTGTPSLDANTTAAFYVDGAHSIAVSALLELNRGIVDNSTSS